MIAEQKIMARHLKKNVALIEAVLRCLEFCVLRDRRTAIALAQKCDPQQDPTMQMLVNRLRTFEADEKRRLNKAWRMMSVKEKRKFNAELRQLKQTLDENP